MKLLWLIVFLIPLAYAVEECAGAVEPEDIPCQIVSNWNYTAPCSSHLAIVFNSLGDNIVNYTYGDFGSSGRCYTNWTLTTIDSYTGTVTNGDTFNITVGVDNMQLALIIAIGITIASLLFIAFKLDKEHIILQLGLIFFSIALISLIPAVLIINTANIIFQRLVMGFIVVFWLYIGGYLVYYILKKAGIIVSGKNE